MQPLQHGAVKCDTFQLVTRHSWHKVPEQEGEVTRFLFFLVTLQDEISL